MTGLILLALWDHGRATLVAQDGPPPQLASFITNKEAQARALAKKLDLKVSSDVWAYFRTAQTGQASAVTNAFERLKKRSSQYEGSRDDPTVGTPVWQTLIEVELAIEGFADSDPKYSIAFGNGVIDSIPPGSIYFGGTDPGRGLVTALCKSHADGDPFFTVTQNALADQRYLECDFALKVFGRKDLSGFKGDQRFVKNDYANKLYSKLRSSGGGLYQWRVSNAESPAERKNMTAEADFAFRQAFAFCPRSPEAIYRYVNLLLSCNRIDDALRVATAAQSLEPDNSQLAGLVTQLRLQKQAQTK